MAKVQGGYIKGDAKMLQRSCGEVPNDEEIQAKGTSDGQYIEGSKNVTQKTCRQVPNDEAIRAKTTYYQS